MTINNLIEYYYHLSPDEIIKKEDVYFFSYLNKNFILKKNNIYNGDINDIYDLNKNINILMSSELVLNKDNNVITYYYNEPYILFEIKINYYKKITLEDIYSFDTPTITKKYKSIDMTNWERLWEMKNDYIESQIELLDKKYPIFCLVSNYYIGISENAIKLKKYINSINEFSNISIAHRRINCDDNLFELYNPLNYVIDYRVRDICEFFKSLYFCQNDVNYLMIINYIKKYNLTYKEAMLLFARLLYPSYYFDLCEKYISGEIKEKNLIFSYIEISKKYEFELKKIYIFIEKFYNKKLPNIFWLLKKEA